MVWYWVGMMDELPIWWSQACKIRRHAPITAVFLFPLASDLGMCKLRFQLSLSWGTRETTNLHLNQSMDVYQPVNVALPIHAVLVVGEILLEVSGGMQLTLRCSDLPLTIAQTQTLPHQAPVWQAGWSKPWTLALSSNIPGCSGLVH